MVREEGAEWGGTGVDDAGRGAAGEEAVGWEGTRVAVLGDGISAAAEVVTVGESTAGVPAADQEVEVLGLLFLSSSRRVTSAKSLLVISAPEPTPSTRNAFSNAVFASEYSSRAL